MDGPISFVRLKVCMGTGMDICELSEKPMIVVVNSRTELNHGHKHLHTPAGRVKELIHASGGIPFEFNITSPCGGLTEGNKGMCFALAHRDLMRT